MTRLKLVSTIVFLILCGITKNILVLISLFILFLIGFFLLHNKKIFLRKLVLFLPIILGTFGLQMLFTKGRIIAPGITYEGLYNGLETAGKLLLAVGYSLILITSTPANELAESLDWLTRGKLKLGTVLRSALDFMHDVKQATKAKHSLARTLKCVILKHLNNAEKYQTHS